MNRTLPSTIAMGAVAAIATLAAAVITSATAYADDITVEHTPFVSTLTVEEVRAQLKTPWPGGNPWSSQYNMFQSHGTVTSEQLQRDYILNRDTANAYNGEDSGSALIMKSRVPLPAAGAVNALRR